MMRKVRLRLRRMLRCAVIAAAVISIGLHALGSPAYWPFSLALIVSAVALILLNWRRLL